MKNVLAALCLVIAFLFASAAKAEERASEAALVVAFGESLKKGREKALSKGRLQPHLKKEAPVASPIPGDVKVRKQRTKVIFTREIG